MTRLGEASNRAMQSRAIRIAALLTCAASSPSGIVPPLAALGPLLNCEGE